MFSQRYASALTVIVIALLIVIGVIGSKWMDASVALDTAHAYIQGVQAERAGLEKFRVVCSQAEGRVYATVNSDQGGAYYCAKGDLSQVVVSVSANQMTGN